jgi:hypothetical protein
MSGEARPKAITNGIVVNVDDNIGIIMYAGYSLRATADAIINVRQGSATGTILSTHALAAATSSTLLFDTPIRCEGDLYCEIVSGTAVGSLHIG